MENSLIEKVAYMLSEYLEKKGICTTITPVVKPIESTLRWSWYVDKVKQCGHTECMHIDLNNEDTIDMYNTGACGSAFFVVLEDGSIMTGGNIFINDAFATFDTTMDGAEFIMARPHLYKVYESDEDVCIITSIDGVRKFFDRLEPFTVETEKIEAF